jgi:hypothetical protein
MSRRGVLALALTVAATTGAVYVVHEGQSSDRERMHKLVKREIEEERRKKECAENGGPCEWKPAKKETEEERRKRECAEAGGPCQVKPQVQTSS